MQCKIKINRAKIFIFLVLILVEFSSCISTSSEYNNFFRANSTLENYTFENPQEVSPTWQKLNNYSDFFNFFITEPKSICHAIKIDLSSKDFKILSYPATKDDKSCSAKEIAKKNDCQILFNTTQYSQSLLFLSPKKPVGIIKVNDQEFSKINQKYSALLLAKTNTGNKATIFETQSNNTISAVVDANKKGDFLVIHGGFWQNLKNGKIIEFKDIKDSRTCVGLSEDNKILYLLVVEGEVKSKSVGLSYMDCAAIMQNFGAFNAMQFDSGRSTCLFINKKNALSYNKNPVLPAFIGFADSF